MSTFMTNPTVQSVVLVLLGILFTLGCIWGIPKLKAKIGNKKFSEDTRLLDTLLDSASGILKVVDKDPMHENVWEVMVKLSKELVQVAETMPDWKDKKCTIEEINKQKFQFVEGKMKEILIAQGYVMTPQREELLKLAIKITVQMCTVHKK